MTQKVIKIGTSAAVVIPKEELKNLRLKIGDRVFVSCDMVNRRFVISRKPIDLSIISERDLELIKWTRNFIGRYRKDLEALAKK
ncbi:hypothetical protein A3H65_00775 [Candidatus Giovannonibacteria bacterium RIFCSPLOWO2_02_FULL_45_14]|nr:MAG: hypothetical protein A3E62_01550 [Candidatus Giovannonibacteria bacterium RIFCSPHIGHO2_12_FULL_44_29]OGF91305.1 MAG: hypothetical protein A3H65_00775 [Candidatus Giovannonibacteria bacterium RIFCSPLOWO2_02_FULL_45_14]